MFNYLKSTFNKTTTTKFKSQSIQTVFEYMQNKDLLINIIDEIIEVGKLCVSVKGLSSTKGKTKTTLSEKQRKMKSLGIDIFTNEERYHLSKIGDKPLQFKAVIQEYVDANKRLDGYETLANKLDNFVVVKGKVEKAKTKPRTKGSKKTTVKNVGSFDLSKVRRNTEKAKLV